MTSRPTELLDLPPISLRWGTLHLLNELRTQLTGTLKASTKLVMLLSLGPLIRTYLVDP